MLFLKIWHIDGLAGKDNAITSAIQITIYPCLFSSVTYCPIENEKGRGMAFPLQSLAQQSRVSPPGIPVTGKKWCGRKGIGVEFPQWHQSTIWLHYNCSERLIPGLKRGELRILHILGRASSGTGREYCKKVDVFLLKTNTTLGYHTEGGVKPIFPPSNWLIT